VQCITTSGPPADAVRPARSPVPVGERLILETAQVIARRGGWAAKGTVGPPDDPDAPHCLAGALRCAVTALEPVVTHPESRPLWAALDRLCATAEDRFPGRGGGLGEFYDHPDTTGADCDYVLALAIAAAS
jgi:hypothetical protein